MDMWNEIKHSALRRFIDRSAPGLDDQGVEGIQVFQNSTEEIQHGLARRKPVKLFQAAMGGRKPGKRLEENYLYSTRAFQAAALAAADYRFFQNAIGQSGTADGFPSGVGALDDLETNMDVGGQAPSGKNFVFRQMGLSFNASISVANLACMLDAGALRFAKADQFQLRHGPARLWPGGTGVDGFSTATATTGAHNGTADPRAVRTLRVPRVIKAKESFAYIYHVPRTVFGGDGSTAFTVAAPGCLFTIWLWGGVVDKIVS